MNKVIRERVMKHADMVLDGKTIRQIAKETGTSKSTVHLDVNERIYELDMDKGCYCADKLRANFDEKHIRGGEATAKRYGR